MQTLTVFYNGDDSYPDRLELKLSDAFENPDTSGHFEWTATMLNINKGHNQEIMDKCQALLQYSEFIAKIKEYKESMPIKEAVNKAVNYAISNNYLDGFFKKHKEGIMLSCLTEFNEEAFRKDVREEGFTDAIVKFIHALQKDNASKDYAISQVIKYFDLSPEAATELVNEHWK